MPHPGLRLAARAEGPRHTVVLVGELDLATAPELDAIAERVCSEGARELVLDLRELSFIDSTGLRAILVTRERCEGHGCELFLTPGPPAVERLFDLTGMRSQLRFREPPA
jgi:anti-sigma B factor antagonist